MLKIYQEFSKFNPAILPFAEAYSAIKYLNAKKI